MDVSRLAFRKMRNRRGGLLMFTVLAMFLIFTLSVGVLTVTVNSLHLGNRQRALSTAFNIAESGAETASLWLRDQPYPPANTSPFNPFPTQTLGEGTYTVTIHPDEDNADNFLKTFRVVSVGTVRGVSKTVEIVVRQASFGRFAYFTDKETMTSGNAIWWKAGEVIDGPAHSNNTGGTNFNINYNGSVAPIFQDILTASGNTINYQPSRPNTEEKYRKIFKEGSKGFKLGVPRIDLPPSTDEQQQAAWNGIPPGLSDAVYVRSDVGGGIYVQGNVESMVFSVDPSGNQVVTINQRLYKSGSWRTETTKITVDANANTTNIVWPTGHNPPTSTVSGVPNGVIYCTDDIESLSGTIADNKVVGDEIIYRNSWTVATKVTTSGSTAQDIIITGNLRYNTRPDKAQDSDALCNLKAGTLGLVANNITVANTAPANLEIDAVLLAGARNTTGGSFSVENYNNKTPTGVLTILGGVIQKTRGAVGTFNSSTGVTTSGYAKNYHYDPRLAANPPPFFPTTGQYERLSWQVLPN